jgi:hypothetical protein
MWLLDGKQDVHAAGEYLEHLLGTFARPPQVNFYSVGKQALPHPLAAFVVVLYV